MSGISQTLLRNDPSSNLSTRQRCLKIIKRTLTLLPPVANITLQVMKLMGYYLNEGHKYDCEQFPAFYKDGVPKAPEQVPSRLLCDLNTYHTVNLWKNPQFQFHLVIAFFYALSVFSFFQKIYSLTPTDWRSLRSPNGRDCCQLLCTKKEFYDQELTLSENLNGIKTLTFRLLFVLKILLGLAFWGALLAHVILFYTFCFQKAITSIADCTPVNITEPHRLDCPTQFTPPYQSFALTDLITYCLGGFFIGTWGAVVIPDTMANLKDSVKAAAHWALPCLETKRAADHELDLLAHADVTRVGYGTIEIPL